MDTCYLEEAISVIRTRCLALLVFLAMGICTAQVPNLVGNWTGIENGYFAENGSYKLFENTSINATISEQKDRLFKGNVSWTENGTEVVDSFAGVIGLDNKTLYSAEFTEGYCVATIVSDDEIDLIYLADGTMGAASFEKLYRIK
jgi:hypothetical protein